MTQKPIIPGKDALIRRVGELADGAKQMIAIYEGQGSEDEAHAAIVKALANFELSFAWCRAEVARLQLDPKEIEDFVWLNETLEKYKE